jgi:Trk-type K+ transport system membrane component
LHPNKKDMKLYHKYFLYQNKLLKPYISELLGVFTIFTYICSAVFILTLIVEHGFLVSVGDLLLIHTLRRIIWAIFFWYFTLNLLLQYDKCRRDFKRVTWVLITLFYFTLINFLFQRPEVGGFAQWLWDFINGALYHNVLMLFISLTSLSSWLVRLLGRHTNLALIMAFSFLLIILIGTTLLKLPRCSIHGISWIDSLFISTSAVCVTGLSPVDISSTLTPAGQIVLILLIQIGGLGVMTFTSFFAMFFMRNTSLYNQLAVRDMISSDSLNTLLSTLFYIFLFTLTIEGIGMLSIFFSIHDTMNMTVREELAFSAFHSISAFCNAGFSTVHGNLCYPCLRGNNPFFLIISMLIILGGLGFPILINLKTFISNTFHKLFHRHVSHHRLVSLNTRIVLITTALLLVIGTLSLAVLEWNHAFAGMTTASKWTQALFNATLPRTAGFASLDMTTFSAQSLLLIIFLMWVGGGSQSTAGGIKVNVLAVAFINMIAVLRRSDRVEIFGRQISRNTVRHSDAAIVLSMAVLFVYVFVLSLTEPKLPLFGLVFECVSAISTVGSSLNITPQLSSLGKFLIATLMFIGRVGIITLLMGFIQPKKYTKYRYPSDNIFIN